MQILFVGQCHMQNHHGHCLGQLYTIRWRLSDSLGVAGNFHLDSVICQYWILRV